MTKVSSYLQEHISGVISTRGDILNSFASDQGLLAIKPEAVIVPYETNDVRKVARFTWQLAEKGHPLAISARGAGGDATGAALTKGLVLDFAGAMNRVFEFDPKQQLVRMQPGAAVATIDQVLSLQDGAINSLRGTPGDSTIGGAIASAYLGPYANNLTILGTIDKLEIVLANGDVVQTGRVSSRELNRLKGKEGFVGDIYRGVDKILEDYASEIEQIHAGDYTGYHAIREVRARDGSFDLAPLFVGSQGTLGLITEMILKTRPKPRYNQTVVVGFKTSDSARNAIDQIIKLNPVLFNLIDARLVAGAMAAGRKLAPLQSDAADSKVFLVIGFESDQERHVKKQIKKLTKLAITFQDASQLVTLGESGAPTVADMFELVDFATRPESSDSFAPDIYGGFHVPLEQLGRFMTSLAELGQKEHIDLPLVGYLATGVYHVYPNLSLKKVGDKQKALKLVDEFIKLVSSHNGIAIVTGGEGRLKSRAINSELEERLVEMDQAIRQLFDPHGTLNPGVKQPNDLKQLAGQLKSEPGITKLSHRYIG